MSDSSVPLEISVQETDARLRATGSEKPRLIDVRDPDEFAYCQIAGAQLISLQTLPAEAPTKIPDKSAELILYCHHGMRSMRATEYLRSAGYTNVRSMAGGIDRWSEEIDPSVRRY